MGLRTEPSDEETRITHTAPALHVIGKSMSLITTKLALPFRLINIAGATLDALDSQACIWR